MPAPTFPPRIARAIGVGLYCCVEYENAKRRALSALVNRISVSVIWSCPGGASDGCQLAIERGRELDTQRLRGMPQLPRSTPTLLDLITGAALGHCGVHLLCVHDAYTAAGFKAMWGKVMNAALQDKVIEERFTFHDLLAYYATTHKAERGSLPDLHANPAITARVYDRSRIVKRKAL